MLEHCVVVGKVESASPGKRQVRVELTANIDPLQAFEKWLMLKLSDGRETRSRVSRAREIPIGALIDLTPGAPRDSVARMSGALVYCEEALLIRAEDGLPDLDDLLGMRLVDEAGALIGVVAEAFVTPAHGVIEVARENGSRFMLPVVEPVFVRFDLTEGVIVVNDIAPYAVENED